MRVFGVERVQSVFFADRFSNTTAPLSLARRTPSPFRDVVAEITPVPQGCHAEGARDGAEVRLPLTGFG